MKKSFLLLVMACFWLAGVFAQTGAIENLVVAQRTDGSGLVDIHFDLNGAGASYTLQFEASFDDGANYEPLSETFLTGELANVLPGTGKHIIWAGKASHPETFSTQTRVRVIAIELLPFNCGDNLFDSRDGMSYSTVQIGDQCWMAENLKYLPSVSPSSQGSETDAYYYVYDYQGSSVIGAKEMENFQNYGALYNWIAAITACPEGWYLPNDIEWFSLVYYVGNENDAGGKLKSIRTSPDPHPRWLAPNSGATDERNFSALPGGRATPTGFNELGYSGTWWASKENTVGNVWRFTMSNSTTIVYAGTTIKSMGFSARCLRESTSQPNLPPTFPFNPSPETGSIHQTITPTLTWDCSDPEGDPLTYDVYLGTEDNPPLAVAGISTQTFTNETLQYSTTYYWKIVAHDDQGNSTDGEVWNFSTIEEPFVCGSSQITDIDGNIYNTVQIGNQCWMRENLKTTKYSNNTPIEYPGSNSSDWENNTNGAYAWNNNDIVWKDIYGALYNWFAVNNANGLCPSGWQVPSDSEWGGLISYVVSQGHPNSNVPTGAGNAIKSCRKVNSPIGADCNTTEHPRWDAHGLHHGFDQFGLSILPSGFRGTEGNSSAIGMFGDYWSSTPVDENSAWNRALTYDYGDVGSHSTNSKKYGFAVRCLLINPPPVGYSLNLNIDPIFAGTVTGEGQHEVGEQVNITAEANPGWEFVNWTDDEGIVSEAANFTYTMPAEDVTLTANFVEEQVGFTCGDLLIDTRDGQEYTTVQIGEQCWMAENLNIGTRINGSSSQNDNNILEKYCYNDSEVNCNTYGGLYQWEEMTDYSNTSTVQGICPGGWHLPTMDEWFTLISVVSAKVEYQCNNNPEYIGKSLASVSYWTSTYEPVCAVGLNPTSNNATGFSGMPAGQRTSSGNFNPIGIFCNWWSTDTYIGSNAWSFNMYYKSVGLNNSTYSKDYGFSVRCLKY